ncbi:MAG: hypothetical protein HBSAPP02_13050 [Phycisphaerae bacterium]|nr:MAG: hypothetical protein DCC66_04750 [Planctomycetota bacterium]GJQ26273.1 MAG: hypothetical protein HBSAPP02_13050 [Phycisphaerae bacterium]
MWERILAANDTGDGNSKVKLAVAGGIFVLAAGVAWYNLGGDSAAASARQRFYVCAETGKSFEHTIDEGEVEPIKCKVCGKMDAYAGEACYWVKDENGEYTKAKTKPTWVLWKRRVDPETEEKTYCPDCGHEVVGHNPQPPAELMEAAAREGR